MFGDKLKKLIPKNLEKGDKDNKKKIENLVFFIVLMIITIVIINIIWNGNKQANKNENNISSKQLASAKSSQKLDSAELEDTDKTTNLETQLENILSKIQGVGEVKAFINYSESSQVVAMYNETTKTSNTEESDTSGGTRKIEEMDSQKDIIYEENQDGTKKPITQKIIEPKLEGAIITAKGASNPEIKASIVQAVEAVTGLSTHKIQVFEMN